MARKIIAGNWKMNLNPTEGLELITEICEFCNGMDLHHVDVVIAPPMSYLTKAADHADGKKVSIAAQNCHNEDSGAYTGEVAASMIKDAGADAVIIGHSERRQYFHESGEFLNGKIKQCFKNGLIPVLCVGENLEERKQGMQEMVVGQQLMEALSGFGADTLETLVIAYEPVWAIGTGETASPQQAQDMHHFIRQHISRAYHAVLADDVTILYGGSVKPDNARELFSQPDVDGGLIGGASLKMDSMAELIKIGSEVLR